MFVRFITSPLVYLVLLFAGWSNFAQFMVFGSVTSYNRSTERQERIATLREYLLKEENVSPLLTRERFSGFAFDPPARTSEEKEIPGLKQSS